MTINTEKISLGFEKATIRLIRSRYLFITLLGLCIMATVYDSMIVKSNVITETILSGDSMLALFGLMVLISFSMHLVTFFRRYVRRYGNRKEAVIYASGEAGWSLLLTTVVTIMVLLIIPLILPGPFQISILSIAGIVGTSFIIVIVITPVILSFGRNKKQHPRYLKKRTPRMEKLLLLLGEWIMVSPAKILAIHFTIMVALIIGTIKLVIYIYPQIIGMMGSLTGINIFALGMLLIGIVVMLVVGLGNIKAGLIAIFTILTPFLAILGIIGYVNIPLDSRTAAIMPVILFQAVDDTIHFVNHCKMEFLRTRNYRQCVLRSTGQVGVALVHISLMLSAMYFFYMIWKGSDFFIPWLLTVAGLFSALFATMFITPILIQKFRVFGPEDLL